jgi:hypothetical protein
VHGATAAADTGMAKVAPGATGQQRSARGRIRLVDAGAARVAVCTGTENAGDRVGEAVGENAGGDQKLTMFSMVIVPIIWHTYL